MNRDEDRFYDNLCDDLTERNFPGGRHCDAKDEAEFENGREIYGCS
jgi:hypothetical protein